MCALFSPEILRAGAVKALTWGNVFRRRGREPLLAQKLMVHVDLTFFVSSGGIHPQATASRAAFGW